jgi:hypothetical protein
MSARTVLAALLAASPVAADEFGGPFPNANGARSVT